LNQTEIGQEEYKGFPNEAEVLSHFN